MNKTQTYIIYSAMGNRCKKVECGEITTLQGEVNEFIARMVINGGFESAKVAALQVQVFLVKEQIDFEDNWNGVNVRFPKLELSRQPVGSGV